jgi:glycerol-3-phosphate acyltransferase PlsX
VFLGSLLTKLAASVLMKPLKVFKSKMDYTEYGGAPLMGIAKPVIKAHGSSNPKAFMNAIRQAKLFVENNVNDEIISYMQQISKKESDSKEQGEN